MLYQYSDKKKILFDRSAFEKLTYSDIERVKTRFNILCPDVFLAECINPSKSDRKKILEDKILSFDSLLIFLFDRIIYAYCLSMFELQLHRPTC